MARKESAEEKGLAKYATFWDRMVIAGAALGANQHVRYGLSVPQVISFISTRNDFYRNFLKYKDPTTRTPAVIAATKKEYEETNKIWNALKQQIKNDKSIEPLTPEERQKLLIHTDKETRTPATIPADAPVIVEIGRSFHITKFQVKNRPYKSRLLVKVAYPAAGTQPTESDYQIAAETGRANFTIIAPSEIAKGTVAYLKGFYVNSKGNGPESRPIKFVVN